MCAQKHFDRRRTGHFMKWSFEYSNDQWQTALYTNIKRSSCAGAPCENHLVIIFLIRIITIVISGGWVGRVSKNNFRSDLGCSGPDKTWKIRIRGGWKQNNIINQLISKYLMTFVSQSLQSDDESKTKISTPKCTTIELKPTCDLFNSNRFQKNSTDETENHCENHGILKIGDNLLASIFSVFFLIVVNLACSAPSFVDLTAHEDVEYSKITAFVNEQINQE